MYIYFKEQLKEEQTNIIVKKELIECGFSKELKLIRYILDNDKIEYNIIDTYSFNEKQYKKITRMSCYQYMQLLKSGLDFNDKEDLKVIPIIFNDKINYNIISHSLPNKILRKRR